MQGWFAENRFEPTRSGRQLVDGDLGTGVCCFEAGGKSRRSHQYYRCHNRNNRRSGGTEPKKKIPATAIDDPAPNLGPEVAIGPQYGERPQGEGRRPQFFDLVRAPPALLDMASRFDGALTVSRRQQIFQIRMHL
jgi:hypothetical protein